MINEGVRLYNVSGLFDYLKIKTYGIIGNGKKLTVNI